MKTYNVLTVIQLFTSIEAETEDDAVSMAQDVLDHIDFQTVLDPNPAISDWGMHGAIAIPVLDGEEGRPNERC